MERINIRYYLLYYWMLIRKGASETSQHYFDDWKNPTGNIVSGIVSIAILYWKGGIAAVSNFSLAIEAAIGGALFWAIFVFLWNILIVSPVKQYRIKQAETFGKTWKDIEIKPYKTDKRDGFDVAFRMTSHKELYNQRWSILNVTADIVEFTQGGITKDTAGVRLPILQHVNATFRSANAILSPEGEKEADAYTILPIAKIRNGHAWLLKSDVAEGLEIEKGSSCLVRIKLNGHLSNPADEKLNDCDIFCTLYYDGNKIDVIEWKRTVDYEY